MTSFLLLLTLDFVCRYCGEVDLLSAARVLQLFPKQALKFIIPRIYPQDCLFNMTSSDSLRLVTDIVDASMTETGDDVLYICTGSDSVGENVVTVTFAKVPAGLDFMNTSLDAYEHVTVTCPGGDAPQSVPPPVAGHTTLGKTLDAKTIRSTFTVLNTQYY